MKTDYKVGDDCWIYLSDHKGKTTKGKILKELDLSEFGYTGKYYVIEISTYIDPILEVRNSFSMSPSKNKPIGFWELVKKKSGE